MGICAGVDSPSLFSDGVAPSSLPIGQAKEVEETDMETTKVGYVHS